MTLVHFERDDHDENIALHLTEECLAEVGWWSWRACCDRSDKAVLILYIDCGYDCRIMEVSVG